MPLGYFTDSTPLTPLRDPFNVLVDAVNANETSITNLGQSRAIQTFRWADATERAAQTGMQAGDIGYQIDTAVTYRYSGSAWVPATNPFCVLGKSSSQSLTTTLSPVTWDVEISDTHDMHSNTTNNTRIVAPYPGVYEVTVFVYNSNTTGLGVLQARKNGTVEVQGSFARVAGAGSPIPLSTTFPVILAASDYIEAMVSHSSATGTIGGGTTAGGSTLTMKRIG